jgi:hypothetical protein
MRLIVVRTWTGVPDLRSKVREFRCRSRTLLSKIRLIKAAKYHTLGPMDPQSSRNTL